MIILEEIERMHLEANGKYNGEYEMSSPVDDEPLTVVERLLLVFILTIQAISLTGFCYLLWLIWVRS